MSILKRATVLAAGVIWVVCSPLARADLPPSSPPPWQEGDEWYLNVTSYPRGNVEAADPLDREKPVTGEPVLFDMRVRVAGSEMVGDVSCWRVEFIPVNAPASVGGPARVLVGKADGWARRLVHGDTTREFDPATGVPMVGLPPVGIPLEVFPPRPPLTLRPKAGTDYLTLARYPQTDGFIEEATVRFEGRTKTFNKLLVRQRYISSDKWWFRYERYLYGVKDLEAQIGFPPSPPPTPEKDVIASKPPPPPPPDPLSLDPRLQVKVDVKLRNRPLRELLDLVGSQTQVHLELEPDLESKKLVFGSYVAVQAPAWRVLREVADNFVREGRWEQVGDGYSLSGAQLVPAKDQERTTIITPPRSAWRSWLAFGSVVAVVLMTGWLLWRRHPSQDGAASPPTATN